MNFTMFKALNNRGIGGGSDIAVQEEEDYLKILSEVVRNIKSKDTLTIEVKRREFVA